MRMASELKRKSLMGVGILAAVAIGIYGFLYLSDHPAPPRSYEMPPYVVPRLFPDKLPETPLVDAKGRPFSLQSIRGGYTVLAFGCLT